MNTQNERGIATASRPSVCPSVRLSVCGWEVYENNFTSWGCSLSADPNITDLLQGEHPKILVGIGVWYEKVASGVQKP